MKITIIAHAFPPYVGGLSYVVKNISVNLVRMGYEVEVVTLDLEGDLPKFETYMGVRVKRFKGYAVQGAYFLPSSKLVEYLKKLESDVVHFHNLGSLLTPISVWVLRLRKIRKVLTPHHHESGSTWHTKLLWVPYRPVARATLTLVDVVHAVSEYEKNLLKEHFNVESIVIPNGVSSDVFDYRWNPPKDKIVVTYAGRVEGYKNVDKVVIAASKLRNYVEKPVEVKIIGEGRALRRALRLARSVEVKILHYPFLPRSEYLRELSTTTVFVNLSKYEAYSIVTAEALAMGVPVVVAVPWGKTFADVKKAFLVDYNNQKEIMKALLSAINLAETGKYTEVPHNKFKTWESVVEEIIEKAYNK